MARVLEAAHFDSCFFADTLGLPDIYKGSFHTYLRYGGQLSYLDPMVVLPVMPSTTRHLGLGATLSTTFHHPDHLARILASLDHLSHGRLLERCDLDNRFRSAQLRHRRPALQRGAL